MQNGPTVGLLIAVGLVGLVTGPAGPAAAYTSKGVGVVTAVEGEVGVAHIPEVAARERRPPQEALKFRDDVFFRDVIDTQRESRARLLLRGRAVFTVRELTRVELHEGVAPADPSRTRSLLNLISGAFRFVIQRDLRPQDELEIQTPNAVSAVRGTTGVAAVFRGNAPQHLFEVAPGERQPPPIPAGETVTVMWVEDGTVILTYQGQPFPMQGGEVALQIGNTPPQIFKFAVPDYLATIARQFLISNIAGVAQTRLLAALHQAATAAAAGRGTAAVPGAPVSSVEPAINSLTLFNNRDTVTPFTLSGSAFQPGGSGALPFNLSFSGTAASSSLLAGQFDGSASGTNTYISPTPGIAGGFNGSGIVRARGFLGTVTFALNGAIAGSFQGNGTFTPSGSSGSFTGTVTTGSGGTSRGTFVTR